MANAETVRITAVVPQLLVADLQRSIACYRDELGFHVGFIYEDFYAGVTRDGLGLHLKCAPSHGDRALRRENEHLDVYFEVAGVDALYAELERRGARIAKPLGQRPWGCKDFYVEDVDEHILCFSEPIS